MSKFCGRKREGRSERVASGDELTHSQVWWLAVLLCRLQNATCCEARQPKKQVMMMILTNNDDDDDDAFSHMEEWASGRCTDNSLLRFAGSELVLVELRRKRS
ncbi:conserved hypothetical protein [Coccidioides posadasii str. Silveira]|uniref:Uncharacterized protein n=2 Tax=Coccidioides posadasii TaxID=199306 RepID=E9DBQ6_COCPS|nr:conserved hypothetical protein [Coccidioides posadasii str. Silveira]KMM67730.1 hypothetical protein CPAG_04063 [Coccidioides posadasii RMSCC 3488]